MPPRYRHVYCHIYRHIHVCPACADERVCPNHVPYLECGESDYCPDHTDPHTQAAIDGAAPDDEEA